MRNQTHVVLSETEGQILRERILELHLQKKTQREIAVLVNRSQAQVCQHLKRIKREIMERGIPELKEALLEELEFLNKEARLLEDARERIITAPTETGVATGQLSNAQHERIMQLTDRLIKLHERRCKVMGIDVNKVAVTDPTGQYDAFSDEYRQELIRKAALAKGYELVPVEKVIDDVPYTVNEGEGDD